MRFVYHHRTAGRGGEGVHITSVVRGLLAAGHEGELISPPGVDPLRTAEYGAPYQGDGDGHVHVVPNAIDPSRFARTAREAVRVRLGLENTTVIGFAGWFDRWDRLDRLVDLLKELHPVYPDARLLLVGDGPVARDLS